jgi:sigma-B regulation protein RsbU (phosphoserine phosphatase)
MTEILVIDDDPVIQVVLTRALSVQGYHITIASDGEEGLAKAISLRPALIICDWLMPRLDGLEVCRRVKTISELSTTFFILLTSLGSIEDRVKGLDAGADDFLCKPIEMYELNARVRAGLRLHQVSRDLQYQKELLEAELSEAAEYVSSILPVPLKDKHLSIDVKFIPSRQLGGDSFDYYWLDRDRLIVYLMDVSGHGLGASLPSLSVLNLLRSRSLEGINYERPSEVLKALNRFFPMSEHNDKYFTIWYGVYNCKTRNLVFATAGHPPAILLSPNQQFGLIEKRLKTPGVPIGMFPEAIYRDGYCYINPQSSLYIFSDGIYEIEDGKQLLLGLENFIDLLKQEQKTPNSNLDNLLQQVKIKYQQERFDDDLSIIKIDFT